MGVPTCPNSIPADGAVVLGLVRERSLVFLAKPIRLNGVALGKDDCKEKIRLAAPCRTKACENWDGAICQVPLRAIKAKFHKHNDSSNCSIRSSCVWFFQNQLDACKVCPSVTGSDGMDT